jgi:hypothetical protein
MNAQRSQLAKFLPDNESIRLFEELMRTATKADRNAGLVKPILSDVTATSTTLVDSGITLPVAAGFIYQFEFFGAYTVASAAVGSRWVVDGPAASLLAYSSVYSLTATSRTQNELSAYNLPAAANASSGSTTSNRAVIEGVIQPSSSGDVIARFASEVANSAITAKAGSRVLWQRTL